MPLPTQYLTTSKNLEAIFSSLRNAKAPEKFTTRFLESLEFKASADRLIVGVLKSLGFLDGEGKPTDRYFRYLDQTQSAQVLAEGVRHAYADLFQVNTKAHLLSKADIVNKFKTLSQGSISESVLDKMAMTFTALVKLADFETPSVTQKSDSPVEEPTYEPITQKPPSTGKGLSLGGLHYNIQIILPESRDPKVYDALFRSLTEHLLK